MLLPNPRVAVGFYELSYPSHISIRTIIYNEERVAFIALAEY
jgi:hypothetical protein